MILAASAFTLPWKPARLARILLAATAPVLLAPIVLQWAGAFGDAAVVLYKHWLVNAAILLSALLLGLRAVLVREERVAWGLLAVAVGGYGAGQVYWAFWLEQRPSPPFPSVCDGFWLALCPLGCIALLLLARRRLLGRPETFLDGIAGGAALAAIGEAFAFGPILDGTDGLGGLARGVALAYPFGDLMLIAAVAGVFAFTGWRPGAFWLLLGGGFGLVAVADTVYTVMIASGVTSTTIVTNAFWTLGLVAVGAAAWVPPRQHAAHADSWRMLLVPTAAGAGALLTLVYGAFAPLNALAIVLAAIAIVAGIARAFLSFHDLQALARSRKEALTDHLTGLGNRRLLMRDLEAALAAKRSLWLVLLDLDGFKTYNDRFGHTEGDLLLARLGWRLAASMQGHGGAYRLGGDEFCVLIGDADNPAGVVDGATHALEESGEEFTIVCSSGIVHLPSEADDASTALRIADARMYARKNSRPGAAKHQAAEVALGIMAEAHPTLGRHVDDVSELAVAVGRCLGLDTSELDDLARAADLHDIGKVAIPASILEKPGPLDEHEWRWMHRHTLIGERMLVSAPALHRVAKIVRATHERFDGTGYPDRLAGHEIPLAARIIAVCDTFDAMVSDRAYRRAMPLEQAVAELEKGAGMQFDPQVVTAFLGAQRRALVA